MHLMIFGIILKGANRAAEWPMDSKTMSVHSIG